MYRRYTKSKDIFSYSKNQCTEHSGEIRERDKYLESLLQQVHLSELVSFGEIQLCSHSQISEVLLQGPVQSPQSLPYRHQNIKTHSVQQTVQKFYNVKNSGDVSLQAHKRQNKTATTSNICAPFSASKWDE